MGKQKKVKHNDIFFIIHNECFNYKYSDSMKKETGEKDKFIQYRWVIPMYVYSINKIFDGAENFDLCPVDVTKLIDNKNGWKWRQSFEYSEIGGSIFYTEKEAWNAYNEKYSEENKKVYADLRNLRFIQDKKSDFAPNK
jgi:hypothetical protein